MGLTESILNPWTFSDLPPNQQRWPCNFLLWHVRMLHRQQLRKFSLLFKYAVRLNILFG